MTFQKPVVGSIVHFVLPQALTDPAEIENEGHEHAHRPAIVVRVDAEMRLDLQVFTAGIVDLPNRTGLYTRVHYSEAHEAHSWHYDETIGAPLQFSYTSVQDAPGFVETDALVLSGETADPATLASIDDGSAE